MTLIVGLGNPGEKYESTRHNIGFLVIDKLSKELSNETLLFKNEKKFQSQIASVGDILLVKPQTYMNDSGKAVSAVAGYYHVKHNDIWVIHDDIDLPPGKIKVREKGSSGGHKGVSSILEAIGSDQFVRFRLGIGRGHEIGGESSDEKNIHRRSIIDHVLSRFKRNEAGIIKHLIENGTEAVRLALLKGVDVAMNRYN